MTDFFVLILVKERRNKEDAPPPPTTLPLVPMLYHARVLGNEGKEDTAAGTAAATYCIQIP